MSTVTTNQAVEQQLNLQVANWTLLYTKLHNFHWNVKGNHFFTLHAKFEELYDTAAGYLDDIAERLLAIGGKPVATLKEVLEAASVKEAAGTESADQMVAAVISDFQSVAGELEKGMKAAEEAGDQATSDLLLGIKKDLDKQVWMLNAYLGK
ncbi:Dps family protein [Paenibacillus pinistramenti]|uniref:Dps family protein n=1 Tax=Paenibacillus pinistramenti TaxID=1768003 RepID=UPI001109EA14|nr:DNA starvation/stationary phase protection protein [Paenibacillus pinistramenti]